MTPEELRTFAQNLLKLADQMEETKTIYPTQPTQITPWLVPTQPFPVFPTYPYTPFWYSTSTDTAGGK